MALHFSRDAELKTRMSQMETLKMRKLLTLLCASLGIADHLHRLEACNAYGRYSSKKYDKKWSVKWQRCTKL